MNYRKIDIEVNKYIAENYTEDSSRVIELHKKLVNNGDYGTCLVAPAGLGKSIFFGAMSDLGLIKKWALLVPFKVQVQSEIKKMRGMKVHAFTGCGNEFTHLDNYMSTYDSGLNCLKDAEVLVIDEYHTNLGHANFREVCRALHNDPRPKVYITATEQSLPLLGVNEFIRVDKKHTDKYNNIKLYETQSNPDTIFKTIVNNTEKLEKKPLTLIRHNDKDRNDSFGYYLAEKGVKHVVLYSPSGLDDLSVRITNTMLTDSELEDCQEGIIPKDVEYIICTSVLDQGISLKERGTNDKGEPVLVDISRRFEIHSIDSTGSYKRDKGNIIHGDNAVQIYNRNRNSNKAQLNIYGSFGEKDFDLDRDIAFVNMTNEMQGKDYAFEQSVEMYHKNSTLTRDGWIDYMSYYNVEVDSLSFDEIESTKSVHTLRANEVYTYTLNADLGDNTTLAERKLGSYQNKLEFIKGCELVGLDVNYLCSGQRELSKRHSPVIARKALIIYNLVDSEVPAEHYTKDGVIIDKYAKKLNDFYTGLSMDSSEISKLYKSYIGGHNIREGYQNLVPNNKTIFKVWLERVEGFKDTTLRDKECKIVKK